MAWARIDDKAMQNPKISALSDSAFRLWVRGLSYCQANLTDGLIPHEALKEMGAKQKDVAALTKPITSSYGPLWEEHEIGYRVHDFLFWNDSREKVQAQRQKSKERYDRWKRKHNNNGAGNDVDNGV